MAQKTSSLSARVTTPYSDNKINLVEHFIIKFGYNARCHWLKERAL